MFATAEFRRAVAIQLRVIGALMLRELVATGSHGRIPFRRAFMRPTMMIAAFYILGRYLRSFTPAGLPLLVFIITGYLTWRAFVNCFNSVSHRGMGSLLMFPHVTPLDVAISKMAVEFSIYTFIFVVFCLLGMLFEQAPPPADPLGVMVAFWSALLLGTALGLIAFSISRFTTIFNDFFFAVRFVGHIFSGVFFLATDTPTPILNILRWNPLFHCVEWLRQSWWAAYKSPIADPHYIFSCLLFMTAIGLAFERSTRRWQPE